MIHKDVGPLPTSNPFNTLVFVKSVLKGSQSVLYIARVVLTGVYKDPLVNGFNRTMQQHP